MISRWEKPCITMDFTIKLREGHYNKACSLISEGQEIRTKRVYSIVRTRKLGFLNKLPPHRTSIGATPWPCNTNNKHESHPSASAIIQNLPSTSTYKSSVGLPIYLELVSKRSEHHLAVVSVAVQAPYGNHNGIRDSCSRPSSARNLTGGIDAA